MTQVQKRLVSLTAMACLFLGASWWVGESQDELNASTEAKSKDAKIFSVLSPLEVTGIEIDNAHGRFVLRRQRSEADTVGRWLLEAPALGGADLIVVEGILAQVLPIRRRLSIPNPNNESLEVRKKRYGLDTPAQSLTLKTAEGNETVQFGMSNSFDKSMYAFIVRESDIVSVPNTLRHQLDKRLFDLRDKQLIDFEKSDVSRVTVTYAGKSIVFEREANTWTFDDGKGRLPVSGERMQDLLQDMKALKFNTIISERATLKNLAEGGFPERAWSIELGMGPNREMVRTLRLGLTTTDEVEVLMGYTDSESPLGELVRGRWPSLLKAGFQGLIDRRVLPVTFEIGDSIEIREEDASFKLTLIEPELWTSESLPANLLNQNRVKGLVFSLNRLEKIRVVSNEIDLVDAQAQRAISERRVLTVRRGEQEWVFRPQDGEEPNEVWVDGAVYQVDATRLGDLLWSENEYRSKAE